MLRDAVWPQVILEGPLPKLRGHHSKLPCRVLLQTVLVPLFAISGPVPLPQARGFPSTRVRPPRGVGDLLLCHAEHSSCRVELCEKDDSTDQGITLTSFDIISTTDQRDFFV